MSRRASGRVRRIAYDARLDLAIQAGPVYLRRSAQRPATLTERGSQDRTTQRRLLEAYNSASFSSQTQDGAYPTAPELELTVPRD